MKHLEHNTSYRFHKASRIEDYQMKYSIGVRFTKTTLQEVTNDFSIGFFLVGTPQKESERQLELRGDSKDHKGKGG